MGWRTSTLFQVLLGMLAISLPGSIVTAEPHAAHATQTVEERLVRGQSMSPLLEPGQTVKVLRGYYLDHPIERDDLVLVEYAGNEAPLVKSIKGVPNDTLALEQAQAGAGWHILVNGEVVTNSEGTPYCIDERGARMLALYVRDYHGLIPRDAYLVLGDRPRGSLDATRFGLIDRSSILAKAVSR